MAFKKSLLRQSRGMFGCLHALAARAGEQLWLRDAAPVPLSRYVLVINIPVCFQHGQWLRSVLHLHLDNRKALYILPLQELKAISVLEWD